MRKGPFRDWNGLFHNHPPASHHTRDRSFAAAIFRTTQQGAVFRGTPSLSLNMQTLRALIQASPLGIIAVGFDGRLRWWNPAAESIFGWQEKEVLGKQIVPEARIVGVADVVEAISSHRPALMKMAAIREIHDGAGTRHDPKVATALFSLLAAFGCPSQGEN